VVLILTLTLTLNILTAFIRLGRAGPAGAGCPPYYYYLAFAEINTLANAEINTLTLLSALCPSYYYLTVDNPYPVRGI